MIRLALIVAAFFAVFAPPKADALLCNVLTGCSCNVTASDMTFGNINPLTAGTATASSTVTVHCTGVIDLFPSVLARVNAGTHGTVADRRMRSAAGHYLHYNIYDAELNGSLVGDAIAAPGILVTDGILSLGSWTTNRTLHGRAPQDTTARTGSYTDTITVRIDW